MSFAHPPKRAAALLAEELNRAEIARGLPEDEDDEEDEEYQAVETEEQEEKEVEEGTNNKRRRKTGSALAGNKSLAAYTSRIRNEANDVFSKLEPIIKPQTKLVLRALVRECAEELPLNAKTRRRATGKWMDPMLSSCLDAERSTSAKAQGEISSAALQLAKQVIDEFGTTRVTESVRFAGEMVDVVKTVDKTSANSTASAAKMSTLEEMLLGLTKKRAVTTVEKSSYDWEKYKQEHQLEEELQDAGKDGFVSKQEFLHRVDDRQFEIERSARERERALRDLKS